MAFIFENEQDMYDYLAEVSVQAEKYIKSELKRLDENVELSPDLVAGEVYKDKSKLPGARLKSNIIGNPARLVKKFKMTARFIVGYEIPGARLFWEIWYLPFYGKYILVDKFGKKAKHSSGESPRIRDVIKHLFDIVSTHDEDEDEEEITRYAGRASRRAERDFSSFNDTDARFNQFSSYNPEEVEKWRTSLLEANVASREMLGKMVNIEVKQYDQTRANKNKLNRLLGLILGRNLVYPSRFQGGVFSKILRVFGKDKEATFVTGFTFEDRIDIEIWFVKSLLSGKGSFYVFNLTAAKLVSKNLKNLRNAFKEVSEIMSFDVGEPDRNDAQRLSDIERRTKRPPEREDDF